MSGKAKMTPSETIEQYTLAEVECQGCGKKITIAVPFKGEQLCSNCKGVNHAS
jgi:hypothetical protein